jgi:hypothetical protein
MPSATSLLGFERFQNSGYLVGRLGLLRIRSEKGTDVGAQNGCFRESRCAYVTATRNVNTLSRLTNRRNPDPVSDFVYAAVQVTATVTLVLYLRIRATERNLNVATVLLTTTILVFVPKLPDSDSGTLP